MEIYKGKMFLIAGLLDAVPMIGVGIAMYILFVVFPALQDKGIV